MLSGDQFWGDRFTSEMVQCNYKGRKVDTYADVPQNIYADLYFTASKYPQKIAIVGDDDASYTYSQFLDMVKKFSQYLYYEKEIRKGDMVALIMRNTIEFCVSVYALAKLAAIVAPVSTKYKPAEWKKLLGHLPIKLFIVGDQYEKDAKILGGSEKGRSFVAAKTNDGFITMLQEKEYEGDPYENAVWEDAFVLMYTSGTSGRSKGAVLSNFNLVNAIKGYENILKVTENDKTIIATPIYHITGLVALMMLFVHCGGTVYLHAAFKPERVLQCVIDHKVTLIHASPTVFIMLLEKQRQFPNVPSLRLFACGSANMPPKAIRELHEWMPGMEFRTVYGLTESSSAGTGFPMDAALSNKIGSSGLPLPGIKLKLIGDDAQEVPKGEIGELCMFSSVILDQYYNLKTKTLSDDGWFRTGDIARFDEDGYVYIVDRKKDMINRGGEKVWSSEVENEICYIPNIIEAAVVGVPDDKYGEAVLALIRTKDNMPITGKEVRQRLGAYMAKFKIPKYIAFVDEIPKTAGNKVNKGKIREQYADKEILKEFEK
ncbi:acyl--CoA ligase [Lachnospiraceae bacterium ZAX-1]